MYRITFSVNVSLNERLPRPIDIMDFSECAKTALKYFQLIGITSFTSQFNASKGKSLNRLYISSAILLQAILNVVLCILTVYHIYCTAKDPTRSHSFTNPDIVMTLFFVFGQVARAICTLTQCIFYKQTIHNILEIFQAMESHFFIHLNHHIFYRELHKRYNGKALKILISHLQYIIISVITYVARKRLRALDHEIHCLQILSILTHMHAFFYIEAINFHFDQLILVIERDTIDCVNKYFQNKRKMPNIYFKVKLRNYKVIYFQLWKVSEQINEYLGWYFVVLFMEFFVELVYSSYWLIEVLTHIEKRLLLARK